MEDVKLWLRSNGLGQYWHKFEEHGWEELSLLAEMSDVELGMCITKPGHRAKFRKALRTLTSTSAISGDSTSLSSVCNLEEIPWEMGAVSRKGTDHASHSLTRTTESTAPLDGAVSMNAVQEVDKTKSIETVLEEDRKHSVDTNRAVDGTESRDAVRGADNTDSTGTIRVVKGTTSMSPDQEIDRKELIDTARIVDGTESTDTTRVVKGTTSLCTDQEIDKKELLDTARIVDGTESINAIREIDGASIDAVQELDRTIPIETVREVKNGPGILEDSRQENYVNATTSSLTNNEEYQFDVARMEPWCVAQTCNLNNIWRV